MTAPAPEAPTRRWRRPRGRALVVGAVVLAALIVAAVVAALLIPGGGPGRDGDRRGGPEIGLTGEYDELGAGPGHGVGPGHGRGDRGPRGDGTGLLEGPVVIGSVVSTAERTLVVTPDGGTPRTLRTNDDTRVRGAGNAALGDLTAGERVVVRVDGTCDAATALSILTPQARVVGTVTALTGTSATVVAADGRTVTADVAALGQQPAVGDVVVLTGTITDGATLTADGVRILS
jgi:hypothetical protein